MDKQQKTIIHWFRKGLRIHDNPALVEAIDLIRKSPNKYVLRPIFILDPEIPNWLKIGPNRWRFLQESLLQLDVNLRRIKSRLYVVRGNPKTVLPKLFVEWQVEHLTFELDIEPYSRQRDILVEKQAKKYNVNVSTVVSHTIYNPDLIIQKNRGAAPTQYQSFLKIVSSMSIPEPVGAPEILPANSKPSKDSNELKDPKCYDCPTLHELGVNEASLGDNLYPGGETEGLKRFQTILQKTDWICSFEKPKTSPNSLQPSTTVLSPYIKFGCISSRLLYSDLQKALKKKKKHSLPPVSLVGQLLWREFFYTAAASEPNFNIMVGNSICRQIPWQNNDRHLEAWTYGQTGYPFIDAIMRQLRQEGWIHHLARHAVACFLTRGDLWISWEKGQEVFEELLLDADWALNAGNWMWLSASAFYYLYSRVYSPVSFGKKTDKDGDYIRKYVPELQNYPKGLIYEPWNASATQQREYGCIIGKDYPQRVVVHENVLKKNMAKMAEAYRRHKDGGGSGGKFDVDNTQVKSETDSPSTSSGSSSYSVQVKPEPTSPSTSSGCSSSKIAKIEQKKHDTEIFQERAKESMINVHSSLRIRIKQFSFLLVFFIYIIANSNEFQNQRFPIRLLGNFTYRISAVSTLELSELL